MEQKLKENIFLCFLNLNHLISSEISQQMYIILKVSWVYVSYLVILKYFATQGLSQMRGFLKKSPSLIIWKWNIFSAAIKLCNLATPNTHTPSSLLVKGIFVFSHPTQSELWETYQTWRKYQLTWI